MINHLQLYIFYIYIYNFQMESSLQTTQAESFAWPTCVSTSIFPPQEKFVFSIYCVYLELHSFLNWKRHYQGQNTAIICHLPDVNESERINRRMYPVDITDLQTLRFIWNSDLGSIFRQGCDECQIMADSAVQSFLSLLHLGSSRMRLSGITISFAINPWCNTCSSQVWSLSKMSFFSKLLLSPHAAWGLEFNLTKRIKK